MVFCLPITKSKNKYYMNLVYLLKYYDCLKVFRYDLYYPSFDKTIYLYLCCSECNKYFPTLTFLTNYKWTKHFCEQSKEKSKSQIE